MEHRIPRWMLDERHKICATCVETKQCTAKYEILDESPRCPLGKLKSYQVAVAEKAWPSGAAPVSGCCDSARNYLRHSHGVQKMVDRPR